MSLQFSFSRLVLSNLLSYGKQLILILESEGIAALNTCAAYLRLKEVDAAMEASYKFDRSSKYTDEVIAADEKRDKLLKQLFHLVKGFTNSTVIPEANAALLISHAIKHFGTDLPKQPFNTESANLNGLLLELSKSDYTAAIDLLKLNGVIALLKAAQLDFEAVFYQRGVDKAKVKDTPAASKLRTDYEQAIRGMVEYAEAQVTINGDAKWKHVCSLIETQNAAFEAQIRNRKVDSPAAAETAQNAAK
jgi:hypothetical protein